MEPQEKMDIQQFIIDRLQDIHRKAEANNFADALASMKEVKAADPKNIYLVAIEKQIAKLNDPALQAENRTSIIKSLPPMIDRAISDVQRRMIVPKVEDSQKVQKEAALEKLKSQYFQRSDDYVEKKEYQRALEEIRRIYIIEPGSVVAKEYEKKIEQLASLQARGESPEPPTEVVKESKKIAPIAEAQKEKRDIPKKSSRSMMFVIAAAAIVILSVGAWFIFLKDSTSKPSDQGSVQQQPALSQEITTPTLPTTTISTPQSEKEPAPIVETSKQPAKIQKTTPEVKPTASEQKPVQTPVTTQPSRSLVQPIQQPTSQPVVNTPPPQPAQQQPKAAESTPAPMPFVAIESQPEFLHREPAIYPEIAKKMGIQGRVTVEVTIDAQGKPIQARIVKSASDVFNEAAIEAVMKYTFKPAMMSTGPVTAKIMIPIDFRMTR
ncbi:MAG: TonB family protein [Bacteroidota bacterium]|jgi:protein TonB